MKLSLTPLALPLVIMAAKDTGAHKNDVNYLRKSKERTLEESSTTSNNKCGGVVPTFDTTHRLTNIDAICQDHLWGPTGETLPCISNNDPCVLDYQFDWINQDPTLCKSDMFYLWDEPTTHQTLQKPPQPNGHDAWIQSGKDWAMYVKRWGPQLQQQRATGMRVSSPMGEYNNVRSHLKDFLNACNAAGGGCDDPKSPGYIDVIAMNAYCSYYNTGSCPGGDYCCDVSANWVCGDVKFRGYTRPVHVTNWATLGPKTNVTLQLRAIQATPKFFECSGPIERVYWYGAHITMEARLQTRTPTISRRLPLMGSHLDLIGLRLVMH